ncbi:MAG: helix-turn-helix domain-containing protein [Saccharofermentans sp.]|nr:helix-turn-helix domain-containing protein [Saccharofermentans sp.]
MERSEFISIMNHKLKLIRTETCLTQEKMADVLGLSKKTLVEIEKGRSSLTWSAAIALAVIFADSDIVSDAFGGDATEVARVIALSGLDVRMPQRTMGGHIWWQNIKEAKGYKIQQNLISRHYRILDAEDHRYFSTFERAEADRRLKELTSGS